MIGAVEPNATIAVGDVLDSKYEITDVLGEGAMGVVYVATHQRLQRVVALKTLKAEIAQDAELVERFEREARAASAIGHRNIVQVFDAGGEPGGHQYIVMERLLGKSLGDLLQEEGSIAIPRALEFCDQILAGLEAAHAGGIVHRDLKPDNIFITVEDGVEVVKILDFGISKILDVADAAILGDSNATQAGIVMGTPLYMSPEQACGKRDLDHRADLWALVCVLYECIAGCPPFSGDNYNQILAAVLAGTYTPLSSRCDELPGKLGAIVDRGLLLERDKRHADAAELRAALREVEIAKPEQQDDTAMLDAFAGLADKVRAQEAEDSVDMAIPEQSFEPSTPAPNSDARFAPPSANSPVSLALEVDSPPERQAEPQPQLELHRAPRKRRPSKFVTRDSESGGSWAVKLVVLFLALVGAGVGYRYFTLGYLLPPSQSKVASLDLKIGPASARVLLDQEPRSERKLSLVPGESYELRVSADGRLSAHGTIRVAAGEAKAVQVYLSHQMPKIEVEQAWPTGEAREAKLQPRETIDAAMGKLSAYRDCGARLGKALQKRLAQRSELSVLPTALVDECVTVLELSPNREPAFEDLDAAAKGLRAAVMGFNKAVTELDDSAGAKRKIVKARKSALGASLKQVKHSLRVWIPALSTEQRAWQRYELQAIEASEGKGIHVALRQVALDSDAWVQAHLNGADDATALREGLKASALAASEFATTAPEQYTQSGAQGYLEALKPLIENEPGTDSLFWHNQAVEVFNSLLIPLM